jgi:hypothetical protein
VGPDGPDASTFPPIDRTGAAIIGAMPMIEAGALGPFSSLDDLTVGLPVTLAALAFAVWWLS